jgi:hypothetical protein
VADNNWFVPPFGAGWMDPAGMFTPGPLLPAATLEGLLRAAGRRLAGRRLTVPGTGGGLRLRLTALRLDPEPIGMAIGQLGDLTVEAADVVWRTITEPEQIRTWYAACVRLRTKLIEQGPVEAERHHEQLRLEAVADPLDLIGPVELVGPRQSGAVLCKPAKVEPLEAGLARGERGHAAPKPVRRGIAHEGNLGPRFALGERAAGRNKSCRNKNCRKSGAKSAASEHQHGARKCANAKVGKH